MDLRMDDVRMVGRINELIYGWMDEWIDGLLLFHAKTTGRIWIKLDAQTVYKQE